MDILNVRSGEFISPLQRMKGRFPAVRPTERPAGVKRPHYPFPRPSVIVRPAGIQSHRMTPWEIIPANDEGQIAAARELFVEYAHSLGIDLCFQGFEQELATLPGAYAPPQGRLLLAATPAEYLGCVALRHRPMIEEHSCEMKRLYVRPQARGRGLGRALAERIIAEAREIGYARIVLDTLATMDAALGLYHSLGFRETAPYYDNPIPEARYLALTL